MSALANKVTVVTGAARGLGRAVAHFKRVFQELHDLRFGLQLLRAVGAFDDHRMQMAPAPMSAEGLWR